MAFPERFVFEEKDIPSDSGWDIRSIIKKVGAGDVPEDFRRFFERDPERRAPQERGLVVSPADGLLEIDESQGRLRLIIRLRFTDVHVQRVPLAGDVARVAVEGLGHFNPSHPKHWLSVQAVTQVESEFGSYTVRQITTLVTRRLETYLSVGQKVLAGERLGRIRLGSTVVLELPRGAALAAQTGDRLYAGETVLARFS